jgi:hypothetical protein
MIRKIGALALFSILCLPIASYAQYERRSARSAERTDPGAFPIGRIVMISEQETATPGYVNQRYVFFAPDCAPMEVKHSGAPINPNDPTLLSREHQLCRQITFASGLGTATSGVGTSDVIVR